MSLECGECERDLRGPHDPSCSKYKSEAEVTRGLLVVEVDNSAENLSDLMYGIGSKRYRVCECPTAEELGRVALLAHYKAKLDFSEEECLVVGNVILDRLIADKK